MRPPLQPGQWSLDGDRCRECEKTSSPHHAQGLCRKCYHKLLQRRLYRERLATESKSARRRRLRQSRDRMRRWRQEKRQGEEPAG